MNGIITTTRAHAPARLLTARVAMTTRVATMDDLPFMDRLQKKHSKQLGFFPRAQMEGYVRGGWVLVAQNGSGSPIGYCASRDRYLKRDELGAVFQLCVDDTDQRKLVGAMLLKSVFERSPYGCKLFCCWCAQDIDANYFWESMGFIPLAFRTGSRTRGGKGTPRVHIFWEKRIRSEDVTTPYWFPSQTGGGSIREDRLVLPIPPGVHWSEAKPIVLPGEDAAQTARPCLPREKKTTAPPPAVPMQRAVARPGGMRFVVAEEKPAKVAQSRAKAPRVKAKHDPKLIAASRDLRDRWLERVNGEGFPPAFGKYDVCKSLDAPSISVPNVLLLPNAA